MNITLTSNRSLAHLPCADIASALDAASNFLCRWDDCFTRANRDDLGQCAVVTGLSRWRDLRDKSKFHSFVRTIARRQRAIAIQERLRLSMLSLDASRRMRELLETQPGEDHWFRIADGLVSRTQLSQALPEILDQLTHRNAALLMGFYAGSTLLELAERYDMTASNVKVRVHRARQRVKQLLIRRLDESGTFEVKGRKKKQQ